MRCGMNGMMPRLGPCSAVALYSAECRGRVCQIAPLLVFASQFTTTREQRNHSHDASPRAYLDCDNPTGMIGIDARRFRLASMLECRSIERMYGVARGTNIHDVPFVWK